MRRYLVIVVAALAAFADCIRGSFHFDDYGMLVDPVVKVPDGLLHVWKMLQTRPLTELSFWINYQLGGPDPAGFHLFSLLLHVAVVCLLFTVLRKLIPEEAAFIAVALFAVHPIQSEAIAYIYARSTLLATFFCLLCWKCWLEGKTWMAVTCFGLALLCKEECVTFPFVLLLFGPHRWKAFAAMIGLGIAAGLRTIYATHIIARSGAGFSAGVTPLDYLASQGAVILRYLGFLIVPWGFTIDPDIHVPGWQQIVAWLWVLGAVAVALRLRGRWLWFAAGMILLVPSSSIFPAADLAADRRMYLPMIAFCSLAGLLLWPVRTWIKVGLAAVLIALSIGRMEVWKTEQSLWTEAIRRAPGKARPRIQLSRAVSPQEALDVLNSAPTDGAVSGERGRVYLLLRRPADALREFGVALAQHPGDAYAINNRGVALMALGQRDAARKDFERALAIDPELSDAKENLARTTAGAK